MITDSSQSYLLIVVWVLVGELVFRYPGFVNHELMSAGGIFERTVVRVECRVGQFEFNF